MLPTKHQAAAELSRRRFIYFAREVAPHLSLTPFHRAYYSVLDKFARGEIRRLIITIPPQHGKSQGASILLPAYMLGIDPSLKIAIASYNMSLASRFNRRVQQLMGGHRYRRIFPQTCLPGKGARNRGQVCNRSEFDIPVYGGGLIATGREGPLTGNTVDIFILDDLYKDAMGANSSLMRDNTWEWYNTVVKTRMHNRSQELLVFTRWHEDDLIGRLEAHERVVELTDLRQPTDPDIWYKLNFEAIKHSPATLLDPRREGEPLWEERHSPSLLESKRLLDPHTFEAMYQGNPASVEGLLYGDNFRTYDTLPADIIKKGNYTDTADTGDDFLCSICYETGLDGTVYIVDVVYSQEPMEQTEAEVAGMLLRCGTRAALIESNNGGRGFARAVGRLIKDTASRKVASQYVSPHTDPRIEWFHQSRNKEARILSNASTLVRCISFPAGWKSRWPRFHSDLTRYRRTYRANRWHDAADALTGVVETECADTPDNRIKAAGFI